MQGGTVVRNENTVSRKEKKKPLSKAAIILIMLTIIVVAVLFALMTYFAIKSSMHAQQLNDRKAEGERGIKVGEKDDVKTDIKVGPNGEIIDKDGKSVPIGGKIINDSDISMSDEMKKAIEIERYGSSNEKITVDGITVQGGVDIDDGYAKFFDNNGVSHNIKVNDDTVIMYGDEHLSKDVIDNMNNLSYDSDGTVVIDHMNVNVSYDSNKESATIWYSCPDGASLGSTHLENISEKNGIFYSNGVKISNTQQEYMTKFDDILDKKYPSTSGDSFFPKYEEPAVNSSNKYEDCSSNKNNLKASTNLESRDNLVQF